MLSRVSAVCALAVALIVTAVSSSPAPAQATDTVSVRSDTTERIIPLAPIVVTAARVPVRADRVGFSVTVLGPADLGLHRAPSAADALRSAGGAFIDEANGPGGPTIVRLRGGEEVFTQILVDGVEINQNGGFFDFQGFDPGNIERIEIARGPQSALFGSSAVSGVVQFVSREGQAGPPRLSAGVEGRAATVNGAGYRARAGVSGGTGVVRYSGGLGRTFSRGIFELPNDATTGDASLRVDLTPSTRLDVAGTFRWMGTDAMLPVRDPGATRVPLDPNARNTRDRVISSVAAGFSPSAALRHQLRATLYREDFVYEDRRDDVATAESFPFFIFDADFRLDSRLVRTSVEYSGDYRADPHGEVVLSWGVRREQESVRDVTSGEFGEGRQKFERGSTAGFAEVLLSAVPRLDLLAGARIEKFEGIDAAVTPRASAVVRLVPGVLAARFAAGRAFKAPNLQQQYLDNPFIVSNPELRAETSTSIEGGLDLTSRRGTYRVAVTFFRQRFEDLIRSVDLGDGTGRQQNRNLGASRATGLEASLGWQPAGMWSAGLDAAWIRTRIVDAAGLPAAAFPEGEELPFRPRTIAGAHVDVAPASGLTARLRATYVGPQTVLSERFGGARVRIDGYTLIGATANLDVRSGWVLYARFDNLLDTHYETAYDRRGIPATGAVGVRWSK